MVRLAGYGLLGGFVSTLATSWYVYDLRLVYRMIAADRSEEAGDWAVVHVGLDDISADVAAVVGRAPVAVFDISHGMPPMTAKKRVKAPLAATPARPEALPIDDAALDTVFVGFAAHEVRSSDQSASLFHELNRVIRPSGRVIIIEHVIDAANVVAFGPGALHFRSPAFWRNKAESVGLRVIDESRLTPFVRRFEFAR